MVEPPVHEITEPADPIIVPRYVSAAIAGMGCFCPAPDDTSGGWWVIVVEDAQEQTLGWYPIAAVADHPEPPIAAAEAMLTRSGYAYTDVPVADIPWTVKWNTGSPGTRLPGG